MSNRLPYNDYVPFAPDDLESSVVVAHQDCDNGVDHKARLWIRRNEDGSVAAHCHNCQRNGFYKDRKFQRPLSSLLCKSNKTNKAGELQLPSDATKEFENWPAKAKVWLFKARLTDEEIDKYGFRWSPGYGRVIIPVYDSDNKLVFWQGRAINPDPMKYLNVSGEIKTHLFYSGVRHGKTVVIVEDVLSAIRVGEYIPSLCSMGVSFNDKQVLEIANGFDQAVIFLDDDNPTVRKMQLRLYKELKCLMNDVKIHHSNGVDPKEYGRDKLREVLSDYGT